MKDIVAELASDVEKKSLLKHPFYQLWNKGELTKEALVEYGKQYYHFTEEFPRFVASIFKNCKDPQLRRKIIHNLVEEELGDYNNERPHAEQWIGFCEAMGLTRDEVTNSSRYEKTQEFLNTMENLTAKDFAGGVAAALAYETQVSEIAKTKKEGLMKFYDIKSKEGLEFFDTHMEADIEHSNTWKQILKDNVKDEESFSKVRESFNQSLDAQWKLLDGILEKTMPNHAC